MHKPFSIRPLSTLPRLYRCFPLRLLTPSPLRSLQSPERPPRFPPPLSTLAPFSYPLILSQPFSLRKCRSAIHLSFSSSFLSFLLLPFHFLSVSLVVCLSLSLSLLSSFLCVQGRSTFLFSFFFPSSTSEKLPAPDFFSITLFPIEHYPSHALSRRATARLPAI